MTEVDAAGASCLRIEFGAKLVAEKQYALKKFERAAPSLLEAITIQGARRRRGADAMTTGDRLSIFRREGAKKAGGPFGPISGAHFNPALTLADAWLGLLAWRNAGDAQSLELAGKAREAWDTYGTVAQIYPESPLEALETVARQKLDPERKCTR